mgnify:CR=1 FL=1
MERKNLLVLWVTLNIYYVRSIAFFHSNHFLIERDNTGDMKNYFCLYFLFCKNLV